MRTFFIFSRPGLPVTAVPSGFSWRAMLLGVLWTLSHGLWLPTAFAGLILVVAVTGVQGLAPDGAKVQLPATAFATLWIAIGIAFGTYGNLWRNARLFAQGYACVATVEADAPSDAVRCFLEL